MSVAAVYPITTNTILDVVDDQDQVIGQASREEIHAQGLCHREVHVWFATPTGEIIFQRRAANKDTFPGLLDATAGGHVELGQSYSEAALCEVAEETGQIVTADDIFPLGKVYSDITDPQTGRRNHCHRACFGYIYQGSVSALTIEHGAGAGFVPIRLSELKDLTDIIPGHLSDEYMAMFTTLHQRATGAID